MKTKIVETVRKLLNMAKDTSSPEEAMIATKRARSLIDKHQLSEIDLLKEKAVFGFSEHNTDRQRVDKFGSIMSVSIAKLNDCQTFYVLRNNQIVIIFEGLVDDAACAKYTYAYLITERDNQARKVCFGKADAYAYRRGFMDGVKVQIDKILIERATLKSSTGTSLVVCKNQLVEKHFGVQKYDSVKVSLVTQLEQDSYALGFTHGNKSYLGKVIEKNNPTTLEEK